MPFALLTIGILLIITAYNNTQDVLASQLKKDFSGTTGFVYWIAAIFVVGALGYIKPLEPVSRAFLALILVVLFLTHQGVFQQFNAALSGSAGEGEKTTGEGGQNTGAGNSAGEKQPLEITVTPGNNWSTTIQ